MKKLPTYVAFCLAALSLGCAKDKPLLLEEEKGTTESITEIASIHYSNITSDTTWVNMEVIEEVYDQPVTHLDLGDPFQEIKDSVWVDIDLPTTLRIPEEFPLPNLFLSDPSVLFNTAKDSLHVSEFPFRVGFVPHLRPEVSKQYDGLIKKIRIERKYQRIYYRADVRAILLGEHGSSYIQEGRFTGSKLGATSTDVEVW